MRAYMHLAQDLHHSLPKNAAELAEVHAAANAMQGSAARGFSTSAHEIQVWDQKCLTRVGRCAACTRRRTRTAR